uniref:Uncharacterized protein n=1 Tax=Vannella robusta TaxID=1487602 RepID=A0A7S4IRY6_9EUKA|mmetsp:Transcript_760/g.946  ORF Transcript_760/g.946 Transcript_760/m.946 type:complete len:137 (+) Transcript_760:3-413(+)
MDPSWIVSGVSDGLILLYAVMLVAGGIVGYKKANSRVSLVCGIVFGCMFVSLVLLSFLTPYFAYATMLAVSLILVIFFSIRLVKTKRPQSTIPGIVGGVVVFIVCIVSLGWGNHDNIWADDSNDLSSVTYSYRYVY